jgi:flagellar hook protein FlgE
MIRSMYSAVSGLSSNQFKMDVIGNDLANVNTIGYKSKRANLASAFSQVARSASTLQPAGIEVGLGAQIASTDTQFTQGAFQRTDVPTDLGIAGDGFFMLGTTSASTTPSFYSRAGNFTVDLDGYLRSQDGNFILGVTGTGTSAVTGAGTLLSPFTVTANDVQNTSYTTSTSASGLKALQIPKQISGNSGTNPAASAPSPDPQNIANFNIGSDGKIVVTGDNGATAAIGFLSVATFPSNQGLSSAPNTNYAASDAAGTPTANPPGTGKAGKTQSGVLELSNVDIAQEFSEMIVTQRGFDANARTITTSDEMLQTVTNLKR